MLMQRHQQGTMEEKESAVSWRKQGLVCESAVTLSQGISSATTRHTSATAIVLPLCKFPLYSVAALDRALHCWAQ